MDRKTIQSEVASIFDQLADLLEGGRASEPCPIILTTGGSELGVDEMMRGALRAAADGVEVITVGPKPSLNLSALPSGIRLEHIEAEDERQAHEIMEELLESGKARAAVTMHYTFPIGVSTIGRMTTPARGRTMFVAATTGTSSIDRVNAMVKNAIYGIATAKACGIAEPTVGIVNLEGARQAERILKDMANKGYKIKFADSVRSDGGLVMRGNDLLVGAADIMVADSLTGNVIMKMFSAFSSGGNYETVGAGYGPGAGPDFDRIVCILSRASGAPVISNALKYAQEVALGGFTDMVAKEIESARRAGFTGFDAEPSTSKAKQAGDNAGAEAKKMPEPKIVTEEIPGIDILELEEACDLLMNGGIFASTGMGCTGPIILVAPEDKPPALNALREGGYIE